MKKILIANRGEIAARILRTAKERGLHTVAVFTNCDRHLPYLEDADTSVNIGSYNAYLNINLITEVAEQEKVDLVHPGYGFLSENPDFASACEAKSLKFLGPSASILNSLGNKHFAKELARSLEIPVATGQLVTEDSDLSKLQFPLMVKAVAGGGGRGMRRVENATELESSLSEASAEAAAAFGNGELIVEELIEDARHIEVQLIGDSKGNVAHAFERDCSIQRRHQKLIEIAPAPQLSESLRQKLFKWSLSVGKSLGLEGLATVEFLVRGEDAYFLEVNPRIQVEHPVTELLCGVDLVDIQLAIAEGQKISQDMFVARGGVAVEARLCAEIPERGFLPDTGNLQSVDFPPTSEALRIDHALIEGLRVGAQYDSLLAKLISYQNDLNSALTQLSEALKETRIVGIKSNRNFLIEILGETFSDKKAPPTTNFLDSYNSSDRFDQKRSAKQEGRKNSLLAAFGLFFAEFSEFGGEKAFSIKRSYELDKPPGLEDLEVRLSSEKESSLFKLEDLSSAETFLIEVVSSSSRQLDLKITEENLSKTRSIHLGSIDRLSFREAGFWIDGDDIKVRRAFQAKDPNSSTNFEAELRAPLPGTIFEIYAKQGQSYPKDTVLFVLESMKTKHQIICQSDCLVEDVAVSKEEFVEAGATLASLREPNKK